MRRTNNLRASSLSAPVKIPNASIAELYGEAPDVYREHSTEALSAARKCPIRDGICDVTPNRHDRAYLVFDEKNVSQNERDSIEAIYGTAPLPLGICSCRVRRQNETIAKPWILCPKRLLALESPKPIIPREVRRLIDIPDGARVGVWKELKFRSHAAESSNRFFEYTFDYLLMALDNNDNPIGVPYIIEVMTSSTRGGGLTEHMVDVLLGRPQRYLRGVVRSVYTPNYRQVFERMLGQFVAKSEIAEKWGGRTIWVFQDVLLDYIEQTTAFDSAQIAQSSNPNVFCEVYRLEQVGAAPESSNITGTEEPSAQGASRSGLRLAHHKSISGRARLEEHSLDFTSFLGLGHAPTLNTLISTIARSVPGKGSGSRMARPTGWFEFRWGDDTDPRDAESDN